MSIFKTRKQNQEFLVPLSKIEETQLVLKDANKYLITSSIPQPEAQILIASREMKHLKRLMWRNARRP